MIASISNRILLIAGLTGLAPGLGGLDARTRSPLPRRLGLEPPILIGVLPKAMPPAVVLAREEVSDAILLGGMRTALALAGPASSASDRVRRRGVVKWYNEVRGYGFIGPMDGGESLYFVANDITGPDPADPLYKPLREGQEVEYSVERDPRGARAVKIVPASRMERNAE